MLQLITSTHRPPQGSTIPKDVRVYKNTLTSTEVVTYHLYTDKAGNRWWTFEDLYALPFIRQVAAKKIIDLYGHGLALSDIIGYVHQVKALARSDDAEKFEKIYAKMLEMETLSTSMADPVKQSIGLCTVYILHEQEHPEAYTNDLQQIKMTTLSLDTDAQAFFFELVDRLHGALWQALERDYSNCFESLGKIVGYKYEGAQRLVEKIAKSERTLQLLLRGMAAGVLSERDRLLQYTVGEFYQELSLFLEETSKKKKHLDQLNKT